MSAASATITTSTSHAFELLTAYGWSTPSIGGRAAGERLLQALHPDVEGVLLDIGCGTGEFALRLAKQHAAHPVFGVDRSAALVQVARQRAHVDAHSRRVAFVCADAERLPFTNCCAAAVAFRSVLTFLGDPARGLLEASRALCEGGRCGFVEITNSPGPTAQPATARLRATGYGYALLSPGQWNQYAERAYLGVELAELSPGQRASPRDVGRWLIWLAKRMAKVVYRTACHSGHLSDALVFVHLTWAFAFVRPPRLLLVAVRRTTDEVLARPRQVPA